MSNILKYLLFITLIISLSLSVYSQETAIDYFGIYSDEHPTILKFDKEIKLFIWESTGEMKELTDDQTDSKSNYMSFSYDNRQGWFGFGYAVLPNGKYFDISNFKNGYLHVNLKTKDKLAVLKIGIKSGVNNEAWITNLSKYGFINDDQWHTLKIPVTDFAISDLSKISQYFMLAGKGSKPGKIEFDEIFFHNINADSSSPAKNTESSLSTIEYFGISSNEHPVTLKFDKEIKLFIWERTGDLKELIDDQNDSKSKYMSFSYDNRQGWFGFGYAVIPNGKYFDMSNYRNGYLHVNLKTKDKLAVLKIGIKSGANDEAWITNLSKYGFINDDQWHTLKIPITDFGISDLSKISQYFMLAGEGDSPGQIEFDEIFFQNMNATSLSSSKVLYGLNFSPYLETQSPDIPSIISEEQIYFRLQIVEPFTQWIRTFSCGDGLENTGKIAHGMGLNTLIGAWIGKNLKENDKQIEAIIKIAKEGDADIVAIGNEVLLRQDLRADQLIKYIQQVKNEFQKTNPKIKVTTVDGYYFLLMNPKLMEVCDVILINCYPFWDGVKIEDSIVALNKIYKRVKKAAKGKEVIISETGWPSAGQTIKNAIPSKENARKYFKNVLDWATKHNIKCFYFSSFDESWKISAEGMVGGYWGIFDNNGNLKYEIDNLKSLCLNTMKEGTTLPIEGIYIPSGYMGDSKTIQINTITNTGNYKKILKISLSARSSPFWSGIYWQYPANNWGSQPGLKLLNPKRLSFYAKGENGGEIVEFKIGGISGDLSDSVNPAIDLWKGGTKLTNDWQQYTVNLKDKDLSSVMGGFCCVASKENNPKECVFYLSDIKFDW